MTVDELEETEKILSVKRIRFSGRPPKHTPFYRKLLRDYAISQVAEAERMVDEYVLEGMYFDGDHTKGVSMSGESLDDVVLQLKKSDPNFGLYTMSFDGGWFVADYNVTAEVRSLI